MAEEEIKTENAENTAEIQPKRVIGRPFKKGQSGNPNGKPKGTKSFSTLFDEVIKKIAKEEKISPNSAEMALFEKAYSEAKKGNFNYFKDIMDRRFGQAVKPVDLTTGGESFFRPTEEEKARALKALKEIE